MSNWSYAQIIFLSGFASRIFIKDYHTVCLVGARQSPRVFLQMLKMNIVAKTFIS